MVNSVDALAEIDAQVNTLRSLGPMRDQKDDGDSRKRRPVRRASPAEFHLAARIMTTLERLVPRRLPPRQLQRAVRWRER